MSCEHLHNEHESWNKEHDQWNAELYQWRHESERATSCLRDLLARMESRSRTLELHAIAIDTLVQKIAVHENSMACDCGEGVLMLDVHEGVRKEHARQGDIHAELGRRHQRLMACLAELEEILTPAGEPVMHCCAKTVGMH